MDMPIYLRCLDRSIDKNQWFVIEASKGLEEEASSTSIRPYVIEGEEQAASKVSQFHLPELRFPDLKDAGLVVCNGVVILVGGYSDRPNFVHSGILCTKLDGKGSWKEIPAGSVSKLSDPDLCGGVVITAHSGILHMYAALTSSRGGPDMYRLVSLVQTDDGAFKVERHIRLPPEERGVWWRRHSLLGYNEGRVYMFLPGMSVPLGQFGYYDMNEDDPVWHVIDPDIYWEDHFSAVAVEGYLICFVWYHPITDEHCPALYAYDIAQRKWNTEPLEGLPNDGKILPLALPNDCQTVPSAAKVPRSTFVVELSSRKFALVWSIVNNDQVEIHWCKFYFCPGVSPLRATTYSSGIFGTGGACSLVSCTAGW